MRPCRFGLSLLAALFFANQILAAPAVPPAGRSAQPASFERLGDLLDRDEIVEGAREMAALVHVPARTSAQEAILHRAVEIGRHHLAKPDVGYDEENASRELVCLGRSRFSEQLPEPLGEDGQPVPPVSVGGDVKRPGIIGQVKPEYTPEARAKHVVGVVTLKIVIDREGCVRKARVLKKLPYGLNESALAAVKAWSFYPAKVDGKPVEVYYVLTVNFQADFWGPGAVKPSSR